MLIDVHAHARVPACVCVCVCVCLWMIGGDINVPRIYSFNEIFNP